MLRIATWEDLPQVLAIETLAFEVPWTRSMFEASFGAPYLFWVFESPDKNIQAYVMAVIVADECQILTIAVDPTAQNQGIGRYLLKAVIQEAHQSAAKEVFLEVRVSNDAALHLYKSLGFEMIGKRKAYYQTRLGPPEDALILRLHL